MKWSFYCSVPGCKWNESGSKGFSTKQNLGDHMKRRHEKKFKLSCSMCNKGFQRKDKLWEHLVTEHGEE
jgi:predicted small metal-binding protein